MTDRLEEIHTVGEPTMESSPTRLELIKKRNAERTPGSWTDNDGYRVKSPAGETVAELKHRLDQGDLVSSSLDNEFIAHAPDDITWLIERVEWYEHAVSQWKEEEVSWYKREANLMADVERLADSGYVAAHMNNCPYRDDDWFMPEEYRGK